MQTENFKTDNGLPPSLYALCFATMIILAGFILPDLRATLLAMQLLPLLAAIVLLAAANLWQMERRAPVEILTASESEIEKPIAEDTSIDQQIILAEISPILTHELNNLMQPALSFSQILQNDPKFSDEKSQDTLNAIVESLRRSAKITSSISQISETGNFDITELPFSHTVKYALEAIRPLLPETLILQFGDLSRFRHQARMNSQQMMMILLLLMLSAARATQKSGMVAVHMRKPADGSNNMAELVVADNRSLPLNPEKLTPIQHILESWDGRVSHHFEPGKGQSISLFIPLIPAA